MFSGLVRGYQVYTNLGPAEKGTKAWGDLLEAFSGRKRSGSKTYVETKWKKHLSQRGSSQPGHTTIIKSSTSLMTMSHRLFDTFYIKGVEPAYQRGTPCSEWAQLMLSLQENLLRMTSWLTSGFSQTAAFLWTPYTLVPTKLPTKKPTKIERVFKFRIVQIPLYI